MRGFPLPTSVRLFSLRRRGWFNISESLKLGEEIRKGALFPAYANSFEWSFCRWTLQPADRSIRKITSSFHGQFRLFTNTDTDICLLENLTVSSGRKSEVQNNSGRYVIYLHHDAIWCVHIRNTVRALSRRPFQIWNVQNWFVEISRRLNMSRDNNVRIYKTRKLSTRKFHQSTSIL